MPTRRRFLAYSVATIGTLAAQRSSFSEEEPRSLGVQLYTVRKQAESDLPNVLKQIHQIGYREVETYWSVYTRPAKELRRMITDAGLNVPSGHFDYAGLDGKFEYAKDLGIQYLVCPMLPTAMWNSIEGFHKAADQFNLWGAKAKSMGMQFAFHNHNYEFKRFGNVTGFDALMERTDKDLVKWEMDCYWVTQAGRNPVEMMKEQYSDRIRLLHLKDRKAGAEPSQQMGKAAQHFTEVGNGTIDWAAVLAVAQQNGIRYLFVEQDFTDGPPMESLRISFQYLKKLMV